MINLDVPYVAIYLYGQVHFDQLDLGDSETLLRKHIEYKGEPLSKEANKRVAYFRKKETDNKKKGNMSIQITKNHDDFGYLAMDDLANFVDKGKDNEASLSKDAKQYKPMRNAIAHTARLTQPAKDKLTSVYENIKARLKTLFFSIT